MLEVFDLTTNAAYIINGDPNLTLHYFPSPQDEANNTNEIMVPSAALVGDDVIIRVENNRVDYLGHHCYVLVTQQLTVNPLPTVVQPLPPYRVCDDNADGIAQFDLTNPLLAPQILGPSQAVSDYTVSYYLTQANAASGTSPLASPYTNTTPNSQNIYIRVVNNATGCVNATGVLTLAVEAYAVANPVTPYHQCDSGIPDNNPFDGVDIIDLDALWTTEVLGGQNPAVFLVSYYTVDPTLNPTAVPLTLQQAQTYTTDAGTDTIWIKVENSSNTIVPFCSDVTQGSITVEPKPLPDVQSTTGATTICVDFDDDTVIRVLTLDANMPNPGDYLYEWYETGDMTTPLGTGPTYEVNTAIPGGGTRNYVVHVTNNFANSVHCDNTSSPPFAVEQSGPAEIAAGTVGYTVSPAFSGPYQTITALVDGYGIYEFSLDDGPRQSSNIFENVSIGMPHVIHVWDVRGNAAYGCDELQITPINIIDYPHYFTPNGDTINDTWN
ncbi:adhesin, partial [Flavobacterium sp. WG47]|nr:adhesin [Flavobacterium sp. WG47]